VVGPAGRYSLDDQIRRWRYHVVMAILISVILIIGLDAVFLTILGKTYTIDSL